MRLWILVVPLVLCGCKRRTGNVIPEGDIESDADTDSDTDTDTDTDTDSDSDSDADADTDACQEDAANEPNDDFDTALALTGNAVSAALTSASPQDFWTFNVPDTTNNIQVDVAFEHAFGNIDVTVYNPTEGQEGSGLSQSDDESVLATPEEVGTYFIRVSFPPGAGCNEYDLNVSFVPPPAP